MLRSFFLNNLLVMISEVEIALIIVFSILFILVFISCAAGSYFAKKIGEPPYVTRVKALGIDIEKGYFTENDIYGGEDFSIKMSDDYRINGTCFLTGNKKKFVILTHGYGWTREGQIKYGLLFRRLGFSFIIYDLRGHGENEPFECTMGHKEAKDLHEIIKWTREKYGSNITLGLHGESLGAAITLLELGFDDKLDFAVADCGFSSLMGLLHYQARHYYHVPRFIADLASLFSKIFNKYSFHSVKPAKAAANSKTPLLLIHGASDEYVPPKNSVEIRDARRKDAYTKLVLVAGADHAKSYEINRSNYFDYLSSFLSENNL